MCKCSICGGTIEHPMIKDYFGNNPYPARIGEEDRCCDMCNDMIVVPLRIKMLGLDFEKSTELANKLNTIPFKELIDIARL